jgi:asparagine synthase (glutamine-hydrolysing)
MGEADETAWQEMVVRHLGLRDWVRLTDLDAFDILGARAQAGLQQHGVLWPPMLHCHAALVDLAAGGGSLVTGQGGDEVLGLQRSAALAYMIKKRPRPTLPLVRHGLHAIAPVPVRRALQRRTADSGAASPWLAAEQALTTDVIMADDAAETPLDYRRSVVRHRRRRNVIAGQVNYGRVLADAQVDLVQPFYDAGFAAGLASSGGRLGHLSRTSLMRMLFSDVLPDAVLSRDTKARFGAVAVGETARQFMAEWNGEGVDPRVVDVEIFRQACLQPTPNFSVQALLQTAWLACHERRSAQR